MLNSSNEPDNAGQANLKVADAVTVHKKYLQPFYGEVQLGTPAVTNGGGATGLNYLEAFLEACTDCSFNFVNVHHYLQRSDFNVTGYASALMDYIDNQVPAVQAKHDSIKGLPIFIGEVSSSFACLDCEAATDVDAVVALERLRRRGRRTDGPTTTIPRRQSKRDRLPSLWWPLGRQLHQ